MSAKYVISEIVFQEPIYYPAQSAQRVTAVDGAFISDYHLVGGLVVLTAPDGTHRAWPMHKVDSIVYVDAPQG